MLNQRLWTFGQNIWFDWFEHSLFMLSALLYKRVWNTVNSNVSLSWAENKHFTPIVQVCKLEVMLDWTLTWDPALFNFNMWRLFRMQITTKNNDQERQERERLQQTSWTTSCLLHTQASLLHHRSRASIPCSGNASDKNNFLLCAQKCERALPYIFYTRFLRRCAKWKVKVKKGKAPSPDRFWGKTI